MIASVGRIVHFYKKNANVNGRGDGPYAALVVDGHGDTYISVEVFWPFRASSCEGSIKHKDNGGEADGRYWDWPPKV